MASISWKTGNSGSWQTGSNWSNGVGPGTTDTALLTANGNYTVTSTAFVEVGNLQLGKGATLNISAGSFELDTGSGLGTVTNAGTVIVGDANQLTLAGTVSNTGTIQESSAGSTTEIRLNASVALSGGGKLTLSDNANNYIFGNASTFVLTNVDNTISGAGQIGDGQMTLVNQRAGARLQMSPDPLLQRRGVSLHPAEQSRMVDHYAAVRQHRGQVAVADRERQIPAQRPQDHLGREVPPSERPALIRSHCARPSPVSCPPTSTG